MAEGSTSRGRRRRRRRFGATNSGVRGLTQDGSPNGMRRASRLSFAWTRRWSAQGVAKPASSATSATVFPGFFSNAIAALCLRRTTCWWGVTPVCWWNGADGQRLRPIARGAGQPVRTLADRIRRVGQEAMIKLSILWRVATAHARRWWRGRRHVTAKRGESPRRWSLDSRRSGSSGLPRVDAMKICMAAARSFAVMRAEKSRTGKLAPSTTCSRNASRMWRRHDVGFDLDFRSGCVDAQASSRRFPTAATCTYDAALPVW